MMDTTLKVLALILFAMALLTWQQPQCLFSLASMVEHLSGRVVRWLRIRAAAKADAIAAYRRSFAWHSSLS